MEHLQEIQEIYLKRMIRSELFDKDITDHRTLSAFLDIPRHYFVSEALSHQAYAATSLPIGFNQTISAPYTVGLMTQSLEVHTHHRVLEIGTGSGYQTAILSRLAEHVLTIERIGELTRKARQVLSTLGISNVDFLIEDGSKPSIIGAEIFDRIMVTCASTHVASRWLEMLKPGGQLVAPLGIGNGQELYRVVKGESVQMEKIGPARFVPLLKDSF